MWIAFYNKEGIGDVLLLTRGSFDEIHAKAETNGNVTLIKNSLTDEVFSVNIFNISKSINIEESGNIKLTEVQQAIVNQLIESAGFDVEITMDNEAKFIVGHVESCEKMEDSDHLSITQVNVGNETLQIVCGAANIEQGMDVVVARHGAVLPSGAIIWNGALRGVESHGMVCSTRELDLAHLEDLPGIWELDKPFTPGTPLQEVVEAYI